ncbi:MAG: Fic family protein [Ruminococcaceae bacterium]|nr:Fic family protein [Oscillospiraceae bacterium]
MNKEFAQVIMLQDDYYSIDDLRYNQKIGIMLSKDEFEEFLDIKDQLIDEKNELMEELPLKTFNSKHCFFVKANYLLSVYNEYLRIHLYDIELNHSCLFDRNTEDMLKSRLFSEIEGTLNVENVPTTHKRIAEVSKMENPTETNDIIIKNMFDAVKFIVKEKPEFNKQNLFKLYSILSNNCLPEDKKLKKEFYYRHEPVYIGKYEGADHAIIDECMNSLFEFANDKNNIKVYDHLLPYICHYYILYIHPYFDFNGRTARMVSFWLNYVNKIKAAPYFMSEAINDSKSGYYNAIVNTRECRNDLTYFLGYILETSIKYSFVYKNLEEIKKELSKSGESLTSAEWVYVKKIIIHNPENFFNYKMFLTYIGSDMTKQGALKALNKFESYGILEKSKNKRNETIFKMASNMITYKYNK